LCRGHSAPPLDILYVTFPFLLKRLLGDDLDSKIDACWALSYISGGGISHIEAVLEAGFLQPIITILDTATDDRLQSTSLLVIGNILSGNETQTQQVLNLSILPILDKHLLESTRIDFRREILWSLSNITVGTSEQLQILLDSNIFEKIISLGRDVTGTPKLILDVAMLCIANATSTATEEQVSALLEMGCFEILLNMTPKGVDPHPLAVVAVGNIFQKQPNQTMERLLNQLSLFADSSNVALMDEIRRKGKMFLDICKENLGTE
jgi:importin subunit alpha-6/7